MALTCLLPPVTAVRMVWARAGALSKDEHSQITAVLTEAALKDIKARAETDERERPYVTSCLATMDATLRNLDVIYKGRQLNFEENEKLRSAYLESVRETMAFGNKARDFLKSLPAMAIGGAGSITLADYLSQQRLSDLKLWGLGLVFAAAGYIVNLVVTRLARKRNQMLYVLQDYERSLYYDHYVTRVAMTLTALYLDLDRIHKNIFGQSYPVDTEVSVVVNEMLKGVRSTFCPYIHKHMQEKKITPELWARCETGKADSVAVCPNWEGTK